MKAFTGSVKVFSEDFPVEAGGPGVQVKVMELRVCFHLSNVCQIFF